MYVNLKTGSKNDYNEIKKTLITGFVMALMFISLYRT